MNVELGTLSKVDLRTALLGDQVPLTNWLAAHLDRIGAALGMELELVSNENTLHGDILARDLGRRRTVIIENALESSDDSRLGKLLTCASDRDAGAVVWVGPEFRTSHRRALEWLNRRGTAEFYAIGLEVFQIGDSKPAARFKLLAGPAGVTEEGGNSTAADGNSVVAMPGGAAVRPGNPIVEQTGRPGAPAPAPQPDHREAY